MVNVEIIGWMAAAATLLTYSQKTMLPLRLAAVASNFLFISYGYFAEIMPTLVLHCVLLPFNSYRLWEIFRQTARMRAVRSGQGDPLDWIAGLVEPTQFEDGATVFRRGDAPNHLYYLKSGRILLEEICVTLQPGMIFGEIAFFTDARERTQTARCDGPCEIIAIDEAEFMRAYYRNPAFAMYLIRLVAERLIDSARQKPDPA